MHTRSLVVALIQCGALLCASLTACAEPVVVPDDRASDLRVFKQDDRVLDGDDALAAMQDERVLVLWVAGNQFFAMERVVRAFQQEHASTDVGVVTLPPGLLLSAINGGGLRYHGRDYTRLPDVYGSVTTAHLRATGRVRNYVPYVRNRLELLVASGNPKHVVDLKDLAREELKVALPNPLNEGIMQVYAKPILERMGLWQLLSRGIDCADCSPVAHVHFTDVHHREIPPAIRAGRFDVGLVWRTEGIEAQRDGGGIEAIALPEAQSAIDQVVYLAGVLESGAQAQLAAAYLDFLISPGGQAAYAAFGFVPVDDSERHLRRLQP